MSQLRIEIVVRLLMAVSLGALIGLERQWRQRLAGMRTNALVALGSALFVILAWLVPNESGPTRIAAQVVSGIGFLGAGIILRDGLTVRGLNTAATLWCAAAIGTLSGSGFELAALVGAIAVVITNIGLRRLATRVSNHASSTRAETRYRIRVACRTGGVAHIRALLIQALNGGPLVLRALQAETRTPGGPAALDALLVGPARDDALVERIVVRLSLESLVSAVRWDVVEDDDQEPTEVANAEIDERLALIGKEVTT